MIRSGSGVGGGGGIGRGGWWEGGGEGGGGTVLASVWALKLLVWVTQGCPVFGEGGQVLASKDHLVPFLSSDQRQSMWYGRGCIVREVS